MARSQLDARTIPGHGKWSRTSCSRELCLFRKAVIVLVCIIISASTYPTAAHSYYVFLSKSWLFKEEI